MKKLLKILIAVFLLPAVFFGFKELAVLGWNIVLNFKTALSFLGGGAVYLLLHFYVYNFSRPYVAAHEITHALVALFFGFRVKKVQIHEETGSVKLDDYNAAVALAPYVLPLYFLVFAAAAVILLYNGYNSELYKNIYAAVFGFLFVFHVFHTVKTLAETKQPDLKMAGGTFFSLFCILFFNLLFAVIFLAVIFPERVALPGMFWNVFYDTLSFWQKVINYIMVRVIELFKL